MKNLIAIFLICSLLTGCAKRDLTPTVYVSGHLYERCGGAPVKNRELYIYQLYTGTNGTGILATGTTDSTGYFNIPYGTSNSLNTIEFRLGGGNYAVTTLPLPLISIDDLNVYKISTCNIVVRLNVVNPYTNNDTLQVADTRDQIPGASLKIAGPFASGILYTAYNYNILLPNYIGNGEVGISPQGFGYRLNNAPTYSAQNYIMKACATNEVIVTIQ